MQDATISVRPLERSDAEVWASLRREALEAHPLAFGASMPDEPAELVRIFLSRIAEPETVIFGAFVGVELIGIVGIHREPDLKQRHQAFIFGMYVTSAKRRIGAGKRLLNAAIEQARLWPGVDQVYLTATDAADQAKRLYESVGFRAWGRAPRALCWQGQCVDETHMTMDL